MTSITTDGQRALFELYGEFKLVSNPADLVGWDLLAILNSDDIAEHSEDIGVIQPIYSADGRMMECGRTETGIRAHVVRRPMFLMGYKADNLIAMMKDKRDVAQQCLIDAAKKVQVLEQEKEVHLQRISLLEIDLKHEIERRDEAVKGEHEMRETVELLTGQLTKLRERLGSEKIVEILAEEQSDV